MDILSTTLISFILILSILKIPNINSYTISILMVFITGIAIKYSNANYSLLLTIIVVLVISNNFLNNENFTDQTTTAKYCIPAKDGKCPHPLNPSINDPNWCCVGNCYCNQPCPPTSCQKKNSWGSCPNNGQVQSIDNPEMCCYGEGCKCNTDPKCPKETTCGYSQPQEEEEETIDPTICPCNTSLECTKKVKEIERDYDKQYDRRMYSPSPPPVCEKYIKNNHSAQNMGSMENNNTTYVSRVRIPNNYTPSSSIMRKNSF